MQPIPDHFFIKHPRGRLITAVLALAFLAVVGLDQVSKTHAQNTLLIYEDPQNIDIFQGGRVSIGSLGSDTVKPNETPLYVGLKLSYSRNRGAAFSMLADLDDQYRIPFFYAVTLIAVILISFYLRSTPLHHYFTRFGLVMILGGAIGNFIDRLHYGYVVDFVDVDWNLFGWKHDFAIFNIADIAINVGVIFLILDMIIHREKKSDNSLAKANRSQEA